VSRQRLDEELFGCGLAGREGEWLKKDLLGPVSACRTVSRSEEEPGAEGVAIVCKALAQVGARFAPELKSG
jgi:hypothetical protein